MSGRCKACNALMSDDDMCRKFPPDADGHRDYSDLCGDCHQIAMEVLFDTYVEPKTYDNHLLYQAHGLSFMSEDGA